jgi:hypothetical protein
MKIKMLGSQSANLLEFRNNSDALITAVNARGVLTNAGRIYYQSSQPSVNASDTGLLWCDNTNNVMHVWNGSAWDIAGGGVDLPSNQTISGAKTFSGNIFLSSSAKLNGQGTSKSVVLAPTNASSVTVDAVTAAFDGVTFGVPVELSAIGTTAKTVLVTMADAQTVSGLKTFSGGLKVSGSAGIRTSDSTTANGSSDDLLLRTNVSASGRYIKVFNNADTATTNGITIRPKNTSNQGALNVDGSTNITGDLTVTGNISSATGLVAASVSCGVLKSENGSGAQNINTTPGDIGPLTFATVTTGGYDTHSIRVTNSSLTQTVAFYWRREQILSGVYTFVIRKITMAPNTVAYCLATSGTLGSGTSSSGVTNSVVGGYATTISLAGQTDAPCVMTFTLAQVV